ncbi:SdpI family protein [Larkinella knui]|uniref:SdpI family protein n=1 Tax=Larkinella knui TaxID=2025310 RepID=A0A3P1CE07_9BACT|nr:SdpI family protein [Larkinella knui]
MQPYDFQSLRFVVDSDGSYHVRYTNGDRDFKYRFLNCINMKWLIVFYFPPLIMLIGSLLYYFYPPKKINLWYGYRTRLSMINGDTWTTANGFASKYILNLISIYSIILSITLLVLRRDGLIHVFYNLKNFFLITMFLLSLLILLSIILAELKLNAIFDSSGNRKK